MKPIVSPQQKIEDKLQHDGFILWLLGKVPGMGEGELLARLGVYQRLDWDAARIVRDELRGRGTVGVYDGEGVGG